MESAGKHVLPLYQIKILHTSNRFIAFACGTRHSATLHDRLAICHLPQLATLCHNTRHIQFIIPMKILIVHYVTAMLIASNTANGLEVEHGDGLKLRGSPALSTFAEAVAANQNLGEFAKGKKESEAKKFANRAKNGSAKRSGNRGNKENEPKKKKKSQAGRFANRAKDS
eukprot:scaffold107181_cov22-Cyclotella_meneghiniana.AAC.1